MGASGNALRTRCVYGCVTGGTACSSGEGYEGWLAGELYQAIEAQDRAKIQELVNVAPFAKDRAFNFPGEEPSMTALALALQQRDPRAVRALLEAGVSPNLPISEEQRSVYAHRSHLAALNGGDPDLQNLVPGTHFEALCATQHKELFMLLLEKSANPNSGIIQICHCGDLEMLESLLAHMAEPNSWQRGSTPVISAVKSKIQPHDKVLALLRVGGDANFMGPAAPAAGSIATPAVVSAGGAAAAAAGSGPAGRVRPVAAASVPYPALTTATRKRDYRMVRILLEAGADVNQIAGDEGLPNVLFWATYWGELELIKLFVTLSKHRLDFTVRKYTNETVFDVAYTSKNFAKLRKPRHIAKLPLPSKPPVVYEKIAQMLEEYRDRYPEASSRTGRASSCTTRASGALTGSTTATRRGEGSAGGT